MVRKLSVTHQFVCVHVTQWWASALYPMPTLEGQLNLHFLTFSHLFSFIYFELRLVTIF